MIFAMLNLIKIIIEMRSGTGGLNSFITTGIYLVQKQRRLIPGHHRTVTSGLTTLCQVEEPTYSTASAEP